MAGVKGEERVIGRQHADADAELIAPFGHVIEIGDAVSQFERVVKREKVAERTEPDPLRPQ